MPKIYRSMKQMSGQPMIGDSATTLGVRVPTDIVPDATDDVHPGTGGMSVSPSLWDVPIHRVPTRLRHLVPDAHGTDSLFVWRLGSGPFVQTAVAPGLQLRLDPANSRHGFVEPEAAMSVDIYRDALTATQEQWIIDEA